MIADSHRILEGLNKVIEEEGYKSCLFLMGRSLGSIPAIELAYHYQNDFRGLIIESGSANNFRGLLDYLGVAHRERLSGEEFMNKEKIASVVIPTCIIHGEHDQIIPVQEGLELHERSGAGAKDILIIEGAGHNDLMISGQEQYFTRIGEFVKKHL